MKAVGIIPARWGSTRFPGKSLAMLCGKPLVRWVWERAKRAGALDDVRVATDDERIRAAVEAFGGRVVMTRSDHPSGTDRVAEAVAGLSAEIVVNIQGDEPLMDPLLIDELVRLMKASPQWDMATAATPIRSDAEAKNPSICKVVVDGGEKALYFSRHPIPFVRDAAFRPGTCLYWRHIGIYLYRGSFLARLVATPPCELEKAECLEQLRALHIGGAIRVLKTDHPCLGVDTPEDIPPAEAAIRRLEMTE
ncbi:MAG: 3-deoxy-manno-octulosonate cytidylyltransferase [Lentisphaerae bacterium]|nr:3-deoxy-manno-octulosonate cytidylyltransferase [Lentisphaerota bacterium]